MLVVKVVLNPLWPNEHINDQAAILETAARQLLATPSSINKKEQLKECKNYAGRHKKPVKQSNFTNL